MHRRAKQGFNFLKNDFHFCIPHVHVPQEERQKSEAWWNLVWPQPQQTPVRLISFPANNWNAAATEKVLKTWTIAKEYFIIRIGSWEVATGSMGVLSKTNSNIQVFKLWTTVFHRWLCLVFKRPLQRSSQNIYIPLRNCTAKEKRNIVRGRIKRKTSLPREREKVSGRWVFSNVDSPVLFVYIGRG